jgi:RNA-directed DNA polymerase
MGRQYLHLYPQIHTPTNLWRAFIQARRGKRGQPAVAAFEYNLEENLVSICNDLKNQTYQPGAYHNFVIQRPKRRLISAAPFRDRVVHHALINVIEPLFERQFIFDSYANRFGKGTHRALDRCTYFLRRYRYVMHLDVRQFFPSIDHQILRNILSRTVADPAVLAVVDRLLASGVGIQTEEYSMVYFQGDDLLAPLRPRGLPIGNLTSQHWANVYLNELDQVVKRIMKCRAYLRYVDDMLLFADDKPTLHAWREYIISALKKLRLTLHIHSAQPRPVETGVPFLGFNVFPDYRRLKRRNGIAFQHHLLQLSERQCRGEISQTKIRDCLLGWINHARYGDTWRLRQAVLRAANLYWE